MKNLIIALTTFSIPFTFNLLKWVNYNNYEISNSEFVTKYENEKVTIKSNDDFKVFIFDKNNDFSVVDGKPKGCEFYMNSNFFDKKNNTIGLVVINGKRQSNRISRGGFFYVLDGKPKVSRDCPSYTDYSSQAFLWGISNGQINNQLINMKHAKEETYRNVVGQNKKGDIIIVTSTFGSMVTIEEILNVGKEFGMVNAVLFDGGTSLDYKFNNGEYRTKSKSLPNWIGSISGYGNPTTYICVN
jgi:hypothetical protein